MNILLVCDAVLPVKKYGGIERVVWWLAEELNKNGFKVTLLVNEGSICPFAKVKVWDKNKPVHAQIPEEIELIHFHSLIDDFEKVDKPYVVTIHGNSSRTSEKFPLNSIFVSKNHAERHGAESYVYNGIDFTDYGHAELQNKRDYFHFLGKAAWQIKNVKGAIKISRNAKEKLHVLGGKRLNISMGFRYTPYSSVKFHGMVGQKDKKEIMRKSKALIFPVLWHEPFGLAIVESMYFGCPIFATPYGAITEIVTNEVGILSTKSNELTQAVKNANAFNKVRINSYAQDLFSAAVMTKNYIQKYNEVLNGTTLNKKAPHLLQEPKSVFLPFS